MHIRNRIRSVAAMAGALLMVLPSMALADDIKNDIDASVNSLSLTAGGSNGTTTLSVVPQNGDGKNGCNLTGSTSLVVNVDSSAPATATVSPSQVTFTSCGDTPVLTVTPLAEGSTTISLSQVSNSTDGTFNLAPASFTVNVQAAPVTNTAPTVPGKPGATSPNNGDFTLNWGASADGESDSITYTLERKDSSAAATYAAVTPAPTSDSYSFSGHPEGTWTYRVKASDGSLDSGFSADSDPVKVDRTAPAKPSAATDTANPDYTDSDGRRWFKGNVAVNWTAGADPVLNDGSTGTGSTANPASQMFTTDGPHTSSSKSVDGVGNQSAAESVLVGRDTTAPTGITFSGAPTTVTLNSTFPTVTCSASDGTGSGLASCVVIGQDTGSVGQKTLTATATDNVGNQSTSTHIYTVGYKFVGFDRPVDNNGALNRLKAGQAVPLKWRLLDANDNPVTNLTSAAVTVASLNCSEGTSEDLLEEVAPGGSTLQNLGDGYYQLNWKTPTSYANSCKTMNLNLGEGSPRTALFRFTK